MGTNKSLEIMLNTRVSCTILTYDGWMGTNITRTRVHTHTHTSSSEDGCGWYFWAFGRFYASCNDWEKVGGKYEWKDAKRTKLEWYIENVKPECWSQYKARMPIYRIQPYLITNMSSNARSALKLLHTWSHKLGIEVASMMVSKHHELLALHMLGI